MGNPENVPPGDRSHGERIQQACRDLRALIGKAVPEWADLPWEKLEATARAMRLEVRKVDAALCAVEAAVNAFWSELYTDGTVEFLVSKFRHRYRKLAREVEAEDIYAQAALQLRWFIVHYDPAEGVPFRIYLARYGINALADALAPYTPSGVVPPRHRVRDQRLYSSVPLREDMVAALPTERKQGDDVA